MTVTVNEIKNMMHYITSEAVTVPNLTMMTSIVSEESLVRDTHTQTWVVYVNIFKVAYDF